MSARFWLVSVPSLATALWLSVGAIAARAADPQLPQFTNSPAIDLSQRPSPCDRPVLSRLETHTIAPGETLEAIAGRYDLIPATLIGLNSNLQRDRSLPVGERISIPPYNGIRVAVPSGATWHDLAGRYGVRADVLFEVNGCTQPADEAFVPGANWSPVEEAPEAVALAYPLGDRGELLLGYGWIFDANEDDVIFHSGWDLAAATGDRVRAAGDGTVAFAGQQGIYGNLVVINHARGRQTRYAHLETLRVAAGDEVSVGDAIGTVGQTGQPDATAPHLHFEVRVNSELGWVAEDPRTYLSVGGRSR